MVLGIAFGGLSMLAACGPVSPETAADQCEERAREARGPTGEIQIGVNNKGEVLSGVSIGITSDAIAGRDPYDVYRSCVFSKTGGDPIRPLEL